MQRTSFEDMNCSVARCLDVVGEWWSLLIIRDAMLGVTRFDDFQARLGISRNILTQRLTWLVGNDVLTRVPYSDHPPRSEYRLTAKGRDLWLVLTAMREWGDRWAPPPGGPPLEVRHKDCGQVTRVVPTCATCGEPMDVRSVTAAPGPGATPDDLARTPLALSPRHLPLTTPALTARHPGTYRPHWLAPPARTALAWHSAAPLRSRFPAFRQTGHLGWRPLPRGCGNQPVIGQCRSARLARGQEPA